MKMNDEIKNPRIVKIFVIALLLIIGFGMIMQYSASNKIALEKTGSSSYFLLLHLKRLLISTLVFLSLLVIDYKKFKKIIGVLFFITLAIVITPLLKKIATNSSFPARWLSLGVISIQTSEVARLFLILFLANYISKHHSKIEDFKHGFMPAFGIIIIFIALIALQPDFSSSVIIYFICMIILYIGGAKFLHILGVSSIMSVFGLIYVRISPYRWQRILTFFDSSNTKQDGYQIHQSLISLSNGGFLGQGFGNSMGKNLYLPEAHTDFIFSIIGEELGFFGTASFIIAFCVLFYTMHQIAKLIENKFGQIIFFSTALSMFIYALFNVAVCSGIGPVTGLPMPFVSYSGSQILINSALLGIVFNIYLQERKSIKWVK